MTGALYHLTPQSLVGERFAPDHFDDVRIALVGFCPPPSALEDYAPQRVDGQPFIHVSPDSIRLLSYGGRRFLSLAHVYGGPVASATMEELAYYGIEHVLAYGLAGGLGTKSLAMGDFYLVEDALAADGTTRHYSAEPIQSADPALCDRIVAQWTNGEPITRVRAATGDAIYRESDAMLDDFRAKGCDVVNLDSAHLYAVSRSNSAGRMLRTVQCGVLSDIVTPAGAAASQSTLSAMLAGDAQGLNPLEKTGDIVRFYIERLAPLLK